MREDAVCHDGKENLLRKLEQVVLGKTLALDNGAPDERSLMLELSPVVLLETIRISIEYHRKDRPRTYLAHERDVVDHHEIEKRVYELRAVGAVHSCQHWTHTAWWI